MSRLCCALVLVALAAPVRAEPRPFPGITPPPPWDPEPYPPHRAARLTLDAELFTGWSATWAAEDENAFRLERAQLGASWAGAWTGAEVRLEMTDRVIGTQLWLRHAHAWLQADLGPVRVLLDVGRVPEPWISALEARYHLRGAAALAAEDEGYFPVSEVGAVLGLQAWDGRLDLAFAVTNGERGSSLEVNEAKDLTVRLSGEVWRGERHALALHGVYRRGRRGEDAERDDRLGGALTLAHPDYGLGAEVLFADGYSLWDRARTYEAWGDVRLLVDWLGVAARFVRTEVEDAAGDFDDQLVMAGLFGDLDRFGSGLPRLRIYLLFENEQLGERPTVERNGGDAQRLSILVEAAAAHIL